MLAVVRVVPLALTAVSVNTTDSLKPAFSPFSARTGSFTVIGFVVPALSVTCIARSEKCVILALPCAGFLPVSVMRPRSVALTA